MDTCPETLPTDCLDLFLSSSEDVKDSQDTRSVCWGRMFPLGSSCTAFGMFWLHEWRRSFHTRGEREEWGEMGGGGVGKERGGMDEAVEGRKMGLHEKLAPNMQHIYHLGTFHGGYRPVSYIF